MVKMRIVDQMRYMVDNQIWANIRKLNESRYPSHHRLLWTGSS